MSLFTVKPSKDSFFIKSVSTQIIIQAPSTKVWEVLADFSSYPQWNSLVPKASGLLAQGEILKVQVSLPNTKDMHYQVMITDFKNNEFLQWLGHFKMRGLFDGQHSYRLRPIDLQSTELIHEEIFSGFLIPFTWKNLGPKFKERFLDANSKLKAYIEKEV